MVTIWDGRFYERIARYGYPSHVSHAGNFFNGTGKHSQSSVAFFPLFPAVTRFADRLLPGSPIVAGVVVATLSGAVATILVWLIAAELGGREVADRAAFLFCFSPGAFVLSLVYAEGLMLALAAGCLLALMHRRWLLAGVLAALATATRPNAIAVVAACGWAAAVAVWRRRDWRAVLAPLLAPVGVAGFMVFLWWHTHEPLVWFRVEHDGWGEGFDFGRSNVKVAVAFARAPFAHPNRLVLGMTLLLCALAVWLLVRARLPGVLNAYTAASLALVLASPINVRPRFLFAAFPLVIAAAKWLKGSAYTVVVASLASSMTLLMIFYGLRRGSYYP